MVERIGRGSGAQRMRPKPGDVHFQRRRIAGQHLVDAARRNRGAAVGMHVVFGRPKQRRLASPAWPVAYR